VKRREGGGKALIPKHKGFSFRQGGKKKKSVCPRRKKKKAFASIRRGELTQEGTEGGKGDAT